VTISVSSGAKEFSFKILLQNIFLTFSFALPEQKPYNYSAAGDSRSELAAWKRLKYLT